MYFKPSQKETDTNILKESAHPEPPEDLQLLLKNEKDCNSDQDSNLSISKLTDLFWNLQNLVTRRLCDTLLQGLS